MKKITQVISSLLPFGPMDAVGVGVIDFEKKSFEVMEAENHDGEIKFYDHGSIYFDLASLTKPLTNSLSYFLQPEKFDEKMLLCLSHRGGIPSWGLLPEFGWKDQVLSYPIKESETLYSDFSALRVMLELEKKGINQKEICRSVWDKDTLNWKDLALDARTLQCGYIHGAPNFGEVHDPNAWTINEFCSHAGLFSTTDGLCRTLLNYQTKTNFISKVSQDLSTHSNRFSFGWDRVMNPDETLAGKGCSKKTFGHLGFTGTSIWIDAERMRGHILLTNSVKHHWFDKKNLNDMRRAIGELVWNGSY